MREAGQRVHPNLSCFTVSSVKRTFRLKNRYVFKSQREETLLVMLMRFCGQTLTDRYLILNKCTSVCLIIMNVTFTKHSLD